MVPSTSVAPCAADTRVIHAVSRTTVVAPVVATGATRVVAVGVTRVLSGTDVAISCIHHLSHVFTSADVDSGGIMALSERGATGPSLYNELDTYMPSSWLGGSSNAHQPLLMTRRPYCFIFFLGMAPDQQPLPPELLMDIRCGGYDPRYPW